MQTQAQVQVTVRTKKPFPIGEISFRGSNISITFDPVANVIRSSGCCTLKNVYPAFPGWWLLISKDGFEALFLPRTITKKEKENGVKAPSHKLSGLFLLNVLRSRKEFVSNENFQIAEAKLKPRD